ncbi:MAG: aminotransferase class III-fold pyridoxal phosphate-dependent enzyme [Syntrophomonadaceae bacterium]
MTELRKDLLNPTLEKILTTFHLDKIYTRGEGCCLTDENGKSYLDFISQYGAIPFGYNPEFVWQALERVRSLGLPSLVQPSLPAEALRLASKLADITPGELCYCTFCQSGTEAVETAIKLARSTTGKEIILSTYNSFHGKTLGALSATGKSSYQEPFRAPAPGFCKIPYNDPAALEAFLTQNQGEVAAFIIEPIQGEGGIIPANPGYLSAVREICHRFNVLLILDEIQTGLGRSGQLFASQIEQIEPDIMLLAKALGGGLVPLGLCISTPGVWNDDFGSLHSSTFANNNLTCAVGCAVIDYLLADDQAVINQVKEKGDYLVKKLSDLAGLYPDVIKEVRGRGLIVGVEFHSPKDSDSYDMAYMCEAGGFTALLCGFLLNVYNIRLAPFLNNSMTLRLEPSLLIEYEEIDYLIQALRDLCKILNYRDYSLLYRFVIGDAARPERFIDYRPQNRANLSSPLSDNEEIKGRFAFIIHYPGPEDIIANNPSFNRYEREELYRLMEWQASIPEPAVCCHMPAIRSRQGHTVEGWLIGVPYGGREIMTKPRSEVVDTIMQAVDMARDLGAQVVGLGALTSVVTRGGRDVLGRGISVTSGNSFTTVMALEALYKGAQKMNIDLDQARAAVVGATGSIGRACSMLLAEEVCSITLLGNPRAPLTSQRRLKQLGEDILTRANRRRKEGSRRGMSGWLNQVLLRLENIDKDWAQELSGVLEQGEKVSWEFMEQICRYLSLETPLSMAMGTDDILYLCDLIVSASNSADYIIHPGHLKAGAVVCDVARPADVSPDVLEQRNDVLVLEGGLVELPDTVCFGQNLGYREGIALACLSETIMLAMEADWQDHSIGSQLSLEAMEYMRSLAIKHGFSLAGLKMGNQELHDREIEHISENARLNQRGAGHGTFSAGLSLTGLPDSFKL